MLRVLALATVVFLGIAIAAAQIVGSFSVAPSFAMQKDKMKEEKSSKSSKKKSLYSRLGGKKAITAVVDEFITVVVGDNRINKFFADTVANPTRLQALKDNLVAQICSATGGSCKYKGKDMVTAHKGMGINDADFTALVEDLIKALDKFSVPEAEKNELLGIFGSLKGDIVSMQDIPTGERRSEPIGGSKYPDSEPSIEVVEQTLDTNEKLQEWLNKLPEGKQCLYVVPLRPKTSLFVLTKIKPGIKSAYTVIQVDSELNDESFSSSVKSHPGKTFIGVHRINETAYLVVFRHGK
ncbi:MAG: group 1 truncated hemoglobin [Acidobacteriota bacterium]